MRILFVTSNRIGDAVLSTGILGALVEQRPGARVWVACGELPAPLFAACPGVERVLPLVKRPRGLHWVGLWRSAAGRIWDLVVDLRGSALAWALAARRRRVLRPDPSPRHRVEQLAELMGFAPPPAPRVWLTDAARAEAAHLVPPGPPVLALGPTANWEGKRWRAERFAELACRMTAMRGAMPGARVALLGAAHERPGVAALIEAIPPERRIDLIGRIDLVTAAACLARADLYVGNDSGLMHLAAAAGAPTLGLFGPSPEVHYAPWGRHNAVVRTEESYDALVNAPGFDFRNTPTLMDSLSVDKALAAAEALWAEAREGRGGRSRAGHAASGAA